MEIVYDETGAFILRKDDGSEVDLLKLEGALTLAQRSREHNRGQVVILEDRLERIRKILAESGGLSERLYTAAEVGDLQASEAELVAEPLRRRIAELEAKAGYAKWCEENDRARAAERRVAELEKSLAESRELVEFKTRVADEIDADRAKLHGQVREWKLKAEGWDHDRHTERDRADQNKAWAERAELRLAQDAEAHAKALAEVKRDRDLRLEELEAAERYQCERAEEHRRSIAARDQLLSAATTRVKAAVEILTRPGVVAARNEIVTSKGAILADAIGNTLAALDA
jgi:hypothetical protein